MSQHVAVHQRIQPHTLSESGLRAQAAIYRQGQTPVVDESGTVHAWNIPPANAFSTGRHLDEIRGKFGADGLAQTLRGLSLTRGREFAATALYSASPAVAHSAAQARMGADPGDPESEEVALGGDASEAIRNSGSSRPLPADMSTRLAGVAGHSFAKVRIHNDPAADAAAAQLGARAFTIGNDIYFAHGNYQPNTSAGLRLLAHEAAHTVQQSGASTPALKELQVTGPRDREELEADRFADALAGGGGQQRFSLTRSTKVGRIQRAITFARSNDAFATNDMGVDPTAAGFLIRPAATPLFQWSADVTISGNAGDSFADFEVGPLQVVRALWLNIYWGTGSDRTHKNAKISTLPARDEAPGSGSPWYSNWRASPTFGASGDVRSTTLADSPQWTREPWTNPVAARGGTRGWFNYGVAFVGYISARDRSVGATADAYQALGNVYWNVSIDGNWNNADPVATRMNTTGGKVSRSGAINGGSSDFPSMHGGSSALSLITETTT